MSVAQRYGPILVMLLVIILLGYPVALLFGLPLAQRDMNDLRKWEREPITSQPVLDARADRELRFPRAPAGAILVRDGRPLDWHAEPTEDGVRLGSAPPEPLVRFGAELERLSPVVYGFPDPAALLEPGRALYVGETLALERSVPAREVPEGERTYFTFAEDRGPIIVDGVLLAEDAVEDLGYSVRLATAPPFGATVRRVSGDWAPLDPAAGTVAFRDAPTAPVRVAESAVRLAETLSGPLDPARREFRFATSNLVENDRDRAVYRDDVLLSDVPERPAERVDGARTEFTFASPRGLLTLDGRVLAEGGDFTRDGATVRFARTPPRNAALRQHPDYVLVDAASGTIALAEPLPDGSVLWAERYTAYTRPGCGATVMECFYALPQHPVPFPHWIALRVGPFLEKYPLHDERNIVRSTLYTTLGTLAALGLGGVIGVFLAVTFVLLRPLERALLPWVIASQTVPIIALVPVLLLVLGNFGITIQTSLLPTAIIGAYIAFFPVVVGTVKGLRSVDPLALDLMKTYAATPLQVFRAVRFPAAVPFFFTSLKLGTAAALVGALVAETESNNRRGLGFQILGQVQSGNVADVWILLIVSALLGVGLVSLIGVLQRIVAPWERS